jgi:hypothetical protein
MAWLLVDAAYPCLTDHERMMTFVELGCGESHLAIERILNAVVSSAMTLSEKVLGRLTDWLDGYVGSPEEPQLRTMLAEIRSHQFDSVSLPPDTHRVSRYGTPVGLRAASASRHRQVSQSARSSSCG